MDKVTEEDVDDIEVALDEADRYASENEKRITHDTFHGGELHE